MSITVGMPKIKIDFESLGLTAIRRSEDGIALMILKDEIFTEDKKSYTFRSLTEVPNIEPDAKEPCPFSEESQKFIKLAFQGEPYKLRVEVFDGTKRTLSDLLNSLELERFNYYCYPQMTDEEQDLILTWQNDMIRKRDKTIKFIGYEEGADNMQWINWCVPWVVYDGVRYEGAEFTPIIAAALAGLSLRRSFTYYDFRKKIDEAALPFIGNEEETEDDAVNNGKLFLTFDGEKYKIARAVNSLVTHQDNVGEDQSKIRIVEVMHLIKDDIRDTWNNSYVGKILNKFENKEHFMALVNRVYFPRLFGDALEATGKNYVDIDMEANRQYIIKRGYEPDDLTEAEIRQYNTGSNLFLQGKVSILDAMEDLYINFKLE